MLHALRELEKGEVHLPVFFIDHQLHFPEAIDFVKNMAQKWNLNLVTLQSPKDFKRYQAEKNSIKKKEIIRMLKINCISQAVKNYNLKALITGIRWDEHRARADEAYFSPREDHIRIHPILHFTEKDVWDYIKTKNVPYNPLYDKGYRSLGEMPFTAPVPDLTAAERAGREKEKEEIMEKLRKLGYF